MKSQIVISSWGGPRRARPYAFTEQGVFKFLSKTVTYVPIQYAHLYISNFSCKIEPNMDYEIKISDDKSFIIVDVKRHIPTQTALIFTKESVDLADKHNISSYLIDVRGIENTWGVFETYQFAQELKKYGRQRLDKVVLLVEPDDKTHSFLETTTVNQGYNTRVFTNYDEAIVWLKDGIPSNNTLHRKE